MRLEGIFGHERICHVGGVITSLILSIFKLPTAESQKMIRAVAWDSGTIEFGSFHPGLSCFLVLGKLCCSIQKDKSKLRKVH